MVAIPVESPGQALLAQTPELQKCDYAFTLSFLSSMSLYIAYIVTFYFCIYIYILILILVLLFLFH